MLCKGKVEIWSSDMDLGFILDSHNTFLVWMNTKLFHSVGQLSLCFMLFLVVCSRSTWAYTHYQISLTFITFQCCHLEPDCALIEVIWFEMGIISITSRLWILRCKFWTFLLLLGAKYLWSPCSMNKLNSFIKEKWLCVYSFPSPHRGQKWSPLPK